MEETPKERIKRKKKERAEQLLKEEVKETAAEQNNPVESLKTEQTSNKEPQSTRSDKYGVSVLEIYPLSTPKPKYS